MNKNAYYKKHDEVNGYFTEIIYTALPVDADGREVTADYTNEGAMIYKAYKDRNCTKAMTSEDLKSCYINGFSVEIHKAFDVNNNKIVDLPINLVDDANRLTSELTRFLRGEWYGEQADNMVIYGDPIGTKHAYVITSMITFGTGDRVITTTENNVPYTRPGELVIYIGFVSGPIL